MDVGRWDICKYFHSMNDSGFANQGKLDSEGRLYKKTRTTTAECNAETCNRDGLCVKARRRKVV